MKQLAEVAVPDAGGWPAVITARRAVLCAVTLVGCGNSGSALVFEPPAGELCVAAVVGQALESECCLPGTRRLLPERAMTVVDLSDIAAIPQGTCGTYLSREPPTRRGYKLPSDPLAYPLKVILPAVTAADPACRETCNPGGDVTTAFGIALETEGLIGGNSGRGISILVPPPWKFVSGGCGEACAWPCLDGYQEFGVRACTTFFHGDFGFATADSNAPSVEAIVELIDAPVSSDELGDGNCCLYAPP